MKAKERRSFGRSLALRLAFIATLILFLCSLLTIFTAPTSSLWIVAIVAAEWGHYWAIVSLLLAVITWRRGRIGNLTAALAVVTAGLFISPVLRAAQVGTKLAGQCEAAFGGTPNANGRPSPFTMFDLFRRDTASQIEVHEHVYANDGPKQLKLDLYRSIAATGPLPLIVVIHGGSWNGGSKAQLPAINRYLASERYAVAAINYRHAPNWKSPAAVEDVFRAIEFLKNNAADLQLDPTRIALIGRSAGAQIALSTAYAGREPAIRGVVDFYGPADLVFGYEVPSRRWVLDSRKVLADYLGGSPEQKPESYAAASAINFVNPTTPPTLLIHGLLDPIVWPAQSQRLAARLKAAARPHLLLELPWATHGCDANLSGPSGQLSLYAIDRFLASVFALAGPAVPNAGGGGE